MLCLIGVCLFTVFACLRFAGVGGLCDSVAVLYLVCFCSV